MKITRQTFLPQGFLNAVDISVPGESEPLFSAVRLQGNLWHCTLECCLEDTGRQPDFCVSLTAGFVPSFYWAPHLTPEDGYIAAQHIFRTPAMILQNGQYGLILIPDIRVLDTQPVPAYLDMDAIGQKMTVGLADARIEGHVLYRREKETVYPKGNLQIAFYVIADTQPEDDPFRQVLSFFWNTYGKKDFFRLTEPKRDLSAYVSHTYDWAFRRWREIVWQEFTIDGKKVGAPAFIVTATQSPNYHGIPHQREALSIWNQAWFCSLRSASGLFRYARRSGDSSMLEYARRTKELALSFPQREGLFYSVAAAEMEFTDETHQNMRSLGWDTLYWGNSDRNPFSKEIRNSPYHILDMSFTADYMLTWYEDLEQDPRLLGYAFAYADRLVTLQDERGYYPGWVSEEGEPMGILDDSPESSMSAAFLLHCFRLSKKERYKASALRAMDVIGREIVPDGRWEDFETYWSCSRYWSDHVGEKIARNHMYKQCNFSMYFTALAFMEAYLATKKEEYLSLGRRVLDELLMTQSSYQPAKMPIPVIGGFGVLNGDAELNDARQSLFAVLLLRYAEITGEKEYLERGFAALRISFSMMYCPENPEAKLQWEKAWPFFNELDYGFNMENYGHNGETSSEGIGIGEFTIYDWGNGAASEAYERLLDMYGQEYVNQEMSFSEW